eukprot:g26507.t1
MLADTPQTVSQLTAGIKSTVEEAFPKVWVVGEVSNCTRASSGHYYLTLKDENAQIRAVMWRSRASRLKFDLHDGLSIVVSGPVEVYAARGSYQLIIESAVPDGLGALELAFRQLQEKLAREGLFAPERKRPLPRFPERIVLITSPTGAAVRDFLQVITRRWAAVDVILIPVAVQGDTAAEQIAAAFRAVEDIPAVDLVVTGRGGGSLEDLWAFNEEIVARAIANCTVPVVSGVGHEIDVSIADLAIRPAAHGRFPLQIAGIHDCPVGSPADPCRGEITVSTESTELRIGFIGAGRMATALARGFLSSGITTLDRIVASDVVEAARDSFRESTGATSLAGNAGVVRQSQVVVLAIKPQHAMDVLNELAGLVTSEHLIVSIVAGIPIATINSVLGDDCRVVRVMPNTPCLLSAGASAFSVGATASLGDAQLVERMLSTVGIALQVAEPLLDAVTGLSGSGPAYVFQFIEALSDGGVRMGLPRAVATQLAAQTVLGAARMVLETGEHPGVLKDNVTSPGGTTIAGLHALERGSVRGSIMNAVEEATKRSRELGQSHPMDSSRMLLGLMSLSQKIRQGDNAASAEQSLYGVIARDTLRMLLSALRFRDGAVVGHSRRVATLAVGLAEKLGWDPPEQKVLEIACLLHDVGKIGIPDHILFKPGKLNPDEANMMGLHHSIGIDVMQACNVDMRVIQFISQANSTFDPTSPESYSNSGETHQGSRILAVADAYDSLSNDQVFREAKQHMEILEILTSTADSRFDANVVSALARWIETEGIPIHPNADEGPRNDPPALGPTDSNDAIQASFLGQVFSHLFMLESMYDGFYLVDNNRNFVIWNEGAERMLGHSAKEVLGNEWSPRLLPYSDDLGNSLTDEQCPMNIVAKSRKATITAVRMKRADGRSAEVELQTIPLIDQHGQIQGTAEIFRDQRRAEKPAEYRELKIAASRDSLTAVANRGEMESQLQVMVNRFNNHADGEPFSLIFMDVDFFKNINDTFGHTVGDEVLVDVARLLQRETYSGELVARYGGEEFVVICPATELEQAHRRAERLRLAIPEADIAGIPNYRITASFGVTEVEPGDTPETVLKRADKALYSAKHTGRNRSVTLTTFDGDAPDVEAGSEEEPQNQNPFEWNSNFRACVASEMIIYKLGGFVTDQKAHLGKVTEKTAELQLGSRGLLPFWGSTSSKQPVRILIEFNHARATSAETFAASRQSEIAVKIAPIGRVKKTEVFHQRAREVVKLLRSYLVAD